MGASAAGHNFVPGSDKWWEQVRASGDMQTFVQMKPKGKRFKRRCVVLKGSTLFVFDSNNGARCKGSFSLTTRRVRLCAPPAKYAAMACITLDFGVEPPQCAPRPPTSRPPRAPPPGVCWTRRRLCCSAVRLHAVQ